jgi:FixJ family two-component response regulator
MVRTPLHPLVPTAILAALLAGCSDDPRLAQMAREAADRHCTPAELAASRIDVPAWLSRLKPRDRKIALKLAVGETTSAVARRFRLSEGRVSQLRGEFRNSWEVFQGQCSAAMV